MRRAARIDANQPVIVAALRSVGAAVQPLHTVGGGCPDLLVSHRMVNYLIEIKDGAKPPSARRLTQDQIQWHDDWRAPVFVVSTIPEALAVIGMGHHMIAEHQA